MYEKIFKIQQEIGKMVKDQPGVYNNKYFDINKLLDKLMPLCHKNKLVLMQPLTTIDNRPALTTIIYDLECEDEKKNMILFSVPLPEVETAQKMGGAITYVRRYSIQSLFGLIAEDDDGQAASQSKPKPKVKEVELEL